MFIVIFHALQFAISSEFCFAKPTFPSRGRLSNKSFVLYYNITEDGLFFVNSTLSSAHRQSLFQTTRLSRGFHFTTIKKSCRRQDFFKYFLLYQSYFCALSFRFVFYRILFQAQPQASLNLPFPKGRRVHIQCRQNHCRYRHLFPPTD